MRIPHALRPIATVAVAAVLGAAACQHARPDAVVLRALICEECTSGEADSVLARGDAAIPMLLAAMTLPAPELRRDVRESARRELRLARRHGRLIALPDSVAISQQLHRFTVGYQMRAASLLRRLGTPAAKHALGTAIMSLPQRYPGSLVAESRHFADSLWRTFP